ncbi:hypothetical protein Tco_1420308 [Tanacetum coccineum]
MVVRGRWGNDGGGGAGVVMVVVLVCGCGGVEWWCRWGNDVEGGAGVVDGGGVGVAAVGGWSGGGAALWRERK